MRAVTIVDGRLVPADHPDPQPGRGSNLHSRPLEEKADAARRVEPQVLPLLAAGRLRVPVAATFPLEQAKASDRFAAGGKLGKLVLAP